MSLPRVNNINIANVCDSVSEGERDNYVLRTEPQEKVDWINRQFMMITSNLQQGHLLI